MFSDSSTLCVRAVCGYGQPYNATSGNCYVSGAASPAPDASIQTCPRGSAFDTFEQQCVYVGDLPTPTWPSHSTVWCSPAEASLVRVFGGPKPYTCRGPPVIAPPSAVVVGTGTGQGSIVKVVQGVPAYPTVTSVSGATTVIVSDGIVTATKTLGGASPFSNPPYLAPMFGNFTSGQLNPGSTFTIVPTATPGTTLYDGIGTLSCAALRNSTSAAALAINHPKLFAACVDALQYGCPTAAQLTFWSMINDATHPPSAIPSPPATPNHYKDALAAMRAATQRVVNESEHKVGALLG